MGISTTETYDAGEVGPRHHDEQAEGAGDQDPGGRSTPALLTPEERSSLIARLDAFNDQLAEASMQLDYGSLDRAADLAALYEDRTWVAELEPVATTDAKGRPRGSLTDSGASTGPSTTRWPPTAAPAARRAWRQAGTTTAWSATRTSPGGPATAPRSVTARRSTRTSAVRSGVPGGRLQGAALVGGLLDGDVARRHDRGRACWYRGRVHSPDADPGQPAGGPGGGARPRHLCPDCAPPRPA